jgi:hypothetical protein
MYLEDSKDEEKKKRLKENRKQIKKVSVRYEDRESFGEIDGFIGIIFNLLAFILSIKHQTPIEAEEYVNNTLMGGPLPQCLLDVLSNRHLFTHSLCESCLFVCLISDVCFLKLKLT